MRNAALRPKQRSGLLDASPRAPYGARRERRLILGASLLSNVLLLAALLLRDGGGGSSWGRAARSELLRAKAMVQSTGAQLEHASAALRDAHAALSAGAALRSEPCGDGGAPGGGDATHYNGSAWLVIGIPTFPRSGGADYLSATLASLLTELPEPDSGDPFGPGHVAVVVMNMAPPGTHPGFDEAARVFGSPKGRAYVSFEEGPTDCDNVAPDAPPVDDMDNPKNIPGPEVRRQTCHQAALLDAAAPRGRHYLFLEDDFETCGHALRALHYALQKAAARAPGWLALRVSYGMNGIVMRSDDVPALAGYLRRHVTRLPPDLLWREWASSGGRERGTAGPRGPRRPLLVYRQNLFSHTGEVSSFAVRPNRRAWPGCYAPMAKVWSLGKREQFDTARCNDEDLSPCHELAPSTADWATRLPLFGVADDGTPP